MATKSNKGKIIFWSIFGLVVGGGGTFIWWKYIRKRPEEIAADQEAAKAGKPPIQWTDDSFPLHVGSRGNNVKVLQQALKITADGLFGYQTQAAAKAKFGKDTVAQSDIMKIVKSII